MYVRLSQGKWVNDIKGIYNKMSVYLKFAPIAQEL